MTGAAPPLSVGIPVYNGERYLSEAIGSVLAQTYSDFELIISDNGSTDGTETICRDFARTDARIRYLRFDENRGGAWNFNRVFRASRSPFFKLAAHDDVCAPRFLEACLDAYEDAPPDTVLCYPRTTHIDEQGRDLGSFDDRLHLVHPEPHRRLRDFLARYRQSNALFGVLRSRAYGSTHLLGAYNSADVVLLAELVLRGPFVEVNEPLFRRRIHAAMSRRAHPTPAEIASWFDPDRRGRRSLRRCRMFGEMIRAISRAPLAGPERARCARAFTAEWLPRYGKTMAYEVGTSALSVLPVRQSH